jgi:hypothetical protein
MRQLSPQIGVRFKRRFQVSEENAVAAREAKHGEKMIEVKIRFWTNNLSPKGTLIPKHAQASGVVRMQANKTHGIKPKHPRAFNSLLDLGAVIEETLIEHGIMLHIDRRMKKYVTCK